MRFVSFSVDPEHDTPEVLAAYAKRWAPEEPRWQLLAKDILKFHAVIWPAMLMSAGYAVPEQLMIHGYLTVKDRKMGKSVGNVLDPFRVIEAYGLDALRFYLLREVRFGNDGDVGYDRVHERYTSELANDLGNLVSRSVAMVARYRDGVVPDAGTAPAIAAVLETARERVAELVDRLELTDAIEAIWVAVRELNRYVESEAPWALAKDPARAGDLDVVLATLCDGIRVLAILQTQVFEHGKALTIEQRLQICDFAGSSVLVHAQP